MNEVILTSSMLTLALALVAVFMVLVVLRVFDWITGKPFYGVREVMLNDPKATAVYYGLRFLGVCMLVGQLFS